jgi:beta-N-acetylhexosaminidase
MIAKVARAAALMVAAAVPLSAAVLLSAARDPFILDKDAERWVAQTLKGMSVDEKVGQLIVPSFESTFLSSDTDGYEQLARLAHDYHVGGFHVFGGTEAAPPVLLNPTYGTVILGQPLEAASLFNRLQALASVPLLNTADFEAGVGFRINGATVFPRQMALGAADDIRLVRESARITGIEARAIGVHVNFAPIADVNNNARNPVINTRSFGANPARVASLVAAYVEGAHQGGMLSTIKHFPGHGDTDVDSHLGLPLITASRDRLDQVELPPFRAGIERGADGVMAAHIVMPALDSAAGVPATFSEKVLGGLLRRELEFRGLIYTDSMSMDAVTKMATPAEGAVRAVLAGADVVLHSPDPIAAFEGLKAAVVSGRLATTTLDAAVTRLLRAKASLALHKERLVDLNAVAAKVGGRAHEAIALEAATRSITLIKDARRSVPLTVPRETPILYLSILDYPSGWRIASPSRTFIPELKKRWPQVTSVELSDRTSPADLEMTRSLAGRFGAVIASVFVRASSASGRMDLAPELVKLLTELARTTERSGTPLIACFFGNPYTASFVPDVPAMLLTYDLYDLPERAAVRAIAGEAPISGRLPIELPGLFPVGHGLDRAAR